MKKIFSCLKPYLRWIIFGGTLFFIAKTLKDHWQQVLEIRISDSGWVSLAIAFFVTIMAHIWSGWVWFWIIREFNQPVNLRWAIGVYLKTNIAKYLPGNIWHFYGRIAATKEARVPLEIATLSVLLEPLLMAAAALTIALIGSVQESWFWQFLCLFIVLIGVHPRILNPVIKYLGKLKLKANISDVTPALELKLKGYPLRPFLGEIGFVMIRGSGFLLTLIAMNHVEINQVPLIFSVFGLAWLLGLIVPGAPGGIGVFEVTTLALLEKQFAPGVVLSAVALYRLISVLAEIFGVGWVWLSERLFSRSSIKDIAGK